MTAIANDIDPRDRGGPAQPLLIVEGLKKHFPIRGGLLLERIYLVEQAIDTMDRLFALFLATRFSPAWEQELARMAKWCQS